MGIGWLGAIIVGGVAGWLAGKLMDMRFGVFMNIIIGIVGAAIAGALFPRIGMGGSMMMMGGGWVGYLISGFIGAVILLFVVKLVRK